MATSISFVFLLLLCIICSLKQVLYAFEERDSYLAQPIQVSPLLPSSVCNHSSKADERKSTLKIVDRYGPCFQPHDQNQAKSPSLEDVLLHDRLRVHSIHSKLLRNSSFRRGMTQIPVTYFEANKYLAKVGFGTPKQEVSLRIDTGSDLTWTQCDPCEKCYSQREPIYDSNKSTTYVSIPCQDPLCDLAPGGGSKKCTTKKCTYKVEYASDQKSRGYFAKETLTLTSSEAITGFMFGCGRYQKGKFGLQAGILGLDRSKVSLVSQTASKYKQIFSYCLPSTAATGHLTFGGGSLPKKITYTRISSRSDLKTLYGLDLVGISVDGTKLDIKDSVFRKAGTVIDSGAKLTFLPPAAYKVLESIFIDKMSKYPTVKPPAGLNVCYDVSGDPQFTAPQISFSFDDGATVTIPEKGSIIEDSPGKVCLAILENKAATDTSIIGSIAQKTMEVVYDIPGNRVGFALDGCK